MNDIIEGIRVDKKIEEVQELNAGCLVFGGHGDKEPEKKEWKGAASEVGEKSGEWRVLEA